MKWIIEVDKQAFISMVNEYGMVELVPYETGDWYHRGMTPFDFDAKKYAGNGTTMEKVPVSYKDVIGTISEFQFKLFEARYFVFEDGDEQYLHIYGNFYVTLHDTDSTPDGCMFHSAIPFFVLKLPTHKFGVLSK